MRPALKQNALLNSASRFYGRSTGRVNSAKRSPKGRVNSAKRFLRKRFRSINWNLR
ncbi:hypothetical protein [Leptospira noguchii]|uniref:Uncharacterized protein n=1 Tax=Leptospira noguchii TaxID=28182 RepID=A0AAE9GAT1_9LEPT|nr:hypothetical protein [Leptospira noguchii]UOG55490.1 hypothetical protein MAL03_11285 [Leptospira noguchii]